jgi:predicted DCC family thiol-disulfide oxidoreductase YuxK
MSNEKPILLFDGVCNVCNVAVDFILKHEKEEQFQFASLQSEKAKGIMKRYKISATVDSIIVIEHGKVYTYSTAVLKIIPKLSLGWQFFRLFVILPKPLRDALYRQFAKRRYQFFGKKESCRIPAPEERKRFLD